MCHILVFVQGRIYSLSLMKRNVAHIDNLCCESALGCSEFAHGKMVHFFRVVFRK